jgi:uncharacterized protein (DUF1499 family)
MTEGTVGSAVPPAKAWWSRAILIGAIIAAALIPVGALGTRFGLWGFQLGLLLVAAGAILAVIVLIVGIAGIIAARRRQRRADLPAVYVGTLVALAVVALMGTQVAGAFSVPAIHDITTDIADPPQFDRVVALRGEGSNPLDYDAENVGSAQQKAYPSIKPLESSLAPADAVQRAADVLKEMELEVVNLDPAAGIVEAVATTFWFGFRDDVVVRVRPAGNGSRIDVRSVSRVGVGDIGANARRIETFLERFGTS